MDVDEIAALGALPVDHGREARISAAPLLLAHFVDVAREQERHVDVLGCRRRYSREKGQSRTQATHEQGSHRRTPIHFTPGARAPPLGVAPDTPPATLVVRETCGDEGTGRSVFCNARLTLA